MKIFTTSIFLLIGFTAFCQQKTTGTIDVGTEMKANLTLDNTSQKATLVLTGPSDRWYALQFGQFNGTQGMASGQDMAWVDNSTLNDGNMIGKGTQPSKDLSQDWTIVSNVVDGGVRTITADRTFSTGDSKDYTFDYSVASIDFVWAKSTSASFSLAYHGSNRGYLLDVPLTIVSSIEENPFQSLSVYPNPTTGIVSLESALGLSKVDVFTHTGVMVKTMNNTANATKLDLNLKALPKGIYLLQVQQGAEKIWQKIILE